jgi:hypothetical protein
MSKIATIPILVGLLVAYLNASSIQQITMELNTGFSQPIGPNFGEWNTGYSVGGDGFVWIFDLLGLGARVGYDQWSPNESNELSGNGDNTPGLASIFEFIPSFRMRTGNTVPVNFFTQGGFGLYLLHSKTELNGMALGLPMQNGFDAGNWKGRFGFSLGGGIAFGDHKGLAVNLFPLYHFVLNNSTALQYFSANAGLYFGF